MACGVRKLLLPTDTYVPFRSMLHRGYEGQTFWCHALVHGCLHNHIGQSGIVKKMVLGEFGSDSGETIEAPRMGSGLF